MAASKGLVLELGSEEPGLQDPGVLAGHLAPQPQTQGVSGGSAELGADPYDMTVVA